MRIRGFRSILDECLTALRQGESVEACLSRYPRLSERLQPLLTLAQRIGHTPTATPRPWAQKTAWDLVRRRAQDLRHGRRFHPHISFPWLRPLAIATSLLLAVLIAAGGTAYAARDSLPDSPLYRVKLATEDVRLWLMFDDSAKAEILLDQSDERTKEIVELIQQGKPVPANVLVALRDRNSRVNSILQDRPQETVLQARMLQQSAAQEQLLLNLWNEVSNSARDEYGETVATLHNTLLRTSGTVLAIGAEDLAGGVLNISGQAEPATDGVWLVGGVEVRIDERTIGYRELEAGSTAKFVVARGANGRLHALNLSTVKGGLPESGTLVSGAIEKITENAVVVGGQRIKITPETFLQLKLKEGQLVQITANPGADGAVASAVKAATTQTGVTAAPMLAYEGAIKGAVNTDGQTNDWVIGGQTFTITPATVIDAQGGAVKSGTRARVEAVSQGGKLMAQRVITLASDGKAESVHLTGVFQGSRGGLWLVSGLAVEPKLGEETPSLGSLMAIDADWQESRIVSRGATVLEPPGQDNLTQLEGPITHIDGDIWTVGFARVGVGKSAKVSAKPIVGARALVWGRQGNDGTLEATYVRVLDERSIISTPRQ